MFIGEGNDQLTASYAKEMEPLKIYNVKQRMWHYHTVSEDAIVLIVENRNTTAQNSSDITFNARQKGQIAELTEKRWSTDSSSA